MTGTALLVLVSTVLNTPACLCSASTVPVTSTVLAATVPMLLRAQGADDGSVLDAEALQQLLGGAAGAGRKGSTMTGSGWAGSKYWKYRSAAAAAARMASGRGDAVKRASAAAHGGRSRCVCVAWWL